MKGQEILNILENENIEYFYPIIAKTRVFKVSLKCKRKRCAWGYKHNISCH